MKNISSLLKNKNFLNNQNYIKSDFLSYKLYQEYIFLENKNRLIQVLYTTSNIYLHLLVLVILVSILYILSIKLHNFTVYKGYIFLLYFLLIFVVIFLYKYYSNKSLLLYKDKFSIKKVFFFNSDRYIIEEHKLVNKYTDHNSPLPFIALTIIIISLFNFFINKNILLNNMFLILFVAFILSFINFYNIVNYIFMLIILKTTQFMNLISYLLNKNKLNKKVFVLKPNTYKINKILEIKDDIVYTDVAVIKKV